MENPLRIASKLNLPTDFLQSPRVNNGHSRQTQILIQN